MNSSLYVRIMQDVNKHQYSIDEIRSKFCVLTSNELSDYITTTFVESLLELTKYNDFSSIFHEFLFNVTDELNTPDELQYLAISIGKCVAAVKELLKPYNKKEKDKDNFYHKVVRLKDDLTSNQRYAQNKMFTMYENDTVKVLKHIVFDLKDIDTLYYVLNNHSELVNIYSSDDEPFSIMVVRYLCDHIDELSNEDIDYYKRVVTMLLLRDEIKLDMDKVDEVLNDISYKLSKNDGNTRHLKYLEYILKKKTDNQQNDQGIIANEVIIPKYLLDGRMDLRSLPTITIDYVKYANNVNMLFDDAFSLQEKEDGTYYLWMHIPDVDECIPRNSELDRYMRTKCESIYLKDNKEPMLPYFIARKISLIKEEERLALSFRIHVDEDGNILGINYFKTVIKVNNNYSKSQADLLLKDPNYSYRDMINRMAEICKKLRINRHDSLGKRTRCGIIMDEYNIWANIATANYFDKNGIVFPFKNFLGEDYSNKYIHDMREFLQHNSVDEDSRNLLYEIVDAKSRIFYSTVNQGNAHFNKLPYGNVGNPLREYISLETDRLIKDLVINELGNFDYWLERIENDCVELSEQSSKVKELYRTSY